MTVETNLTVSILILTKKDDKIDNFSEYLEIYLLANSEKHALSDGNRSEHRSHGKKRMKNRSAYFL